MDSISQFQLQWIVKALVFNIFLALWAGRRLYSFLAGILWFLVAIVSSGLVALCFITLLPDRKWQRLREEKANKLNRLLATTQRVYESPISGQGLMSVNTIGEVPTNN